MISEKENKRISKFLSWVLRHQPESIGIMLDENGWTEISVLLERMVQNDVPADRVILDHIVATNTKKRFAFDETGTKIRASQGHSVTIDLGYTVQKPPDILYHGTAAAFAASIRETGLQKPERHHVHLSADKATAIQVGQRHGKPFVFEVLALQMFSEQFDFYLSENGVWLTDHVPEQYLRASDQL